MISIAILIIFGMAIVGTFIYAMVALIKKDIFIKNVKISKKTGINMSFAAKEKNETLPTSRKSRSK